MNPSDGSVNGEAGTSSQEPNDSLKRKLDELEDDEAIDCDEDAKEELRCYRDAEALLGQADEKNCSYSKGYVQRQALYACNTCEMNVDPNSGDKYRAGFCYACADSCHDGHELFELYTKRNFRCDCGNERFVTTKCLLTEKTGLNENSYNHNFNGLYCTCNRPYPDPENMSDSLQCIICEDWFHSNHLKNWKAELDFNEIICQQCVERNKFLIYYLESGRINPDNKKADASDSESDTEFEKMVTNFEENSRDALNVQPIECRLEKYKSAFAEKYATYEIKEEQITPLFLPFPWRTELCKCVTCLQMYGEKKIEFLTQIPDMVAVYCKNSMKSSNESNKLFSSKFNELNRVQKIEVLDAFNFFKDEFIDYLKQFKKTVMSVDDVKNFIETIKQKRRRQVVIPHFCR